MVLFKKEELKILWLFYVELFISKLFFILPGFMVVYFIGLNLNMFQISLLIAVWPLFSLISDIPTGAIADLYGRKFSVLLGLLLSFIGFLILYFYSNYYIILGVMAFIGIATSLISGAYDAWITDLINKKNKKLLHSYFAKSMSLASMGLVISGLVGAYFVKNFGINIIWLATSISYFISFIMLLFAKEYYIKKKSTFVESIKQVNKKTKISLTYAYQIKPLRYILIAGMILVFASAFSNTLTWTPLLKSLGYPDYAFGYFISAISFIGILAPLISLKLMKKEQERTFILYSLIGLTAFIFGIIIVKNIPLAFFIILGLSIFQYIIYPVRGVYFQKFIPSKLRATIGSIDYSLGSLMEIISMPLVGLLVDLIGPKYTILVSGFIIIPAILIYIKLKKLE